MYMRYCECSSSLDDLLGRKDKLKLSEEIHIHMFDSVLALQPDTMSQLERPSKLAPFKCCTLQDVMFYAHVLMLKMLGDS